jgi:NAD(P)-dependent dehydrogenase (short-subunit alcohol dehydrogenase family)
VNAVTAVDPWQLADIPDQAGHTALVTGVTKGGLGYFTALELARRGARVVLAGRTLSRLEESAAAIRAEHPGAELDHLELDLASLASVRRAAASLDHPLDLLVNNAGVMATPRQVTEDGLDLQLQTNHFAPFLLTGLLLPRLAESGNARVVTLSSVLHRLARSAPLSPPSGRRYRPWIVYGQSKLANLLFTYELERRLREAALPVKALAAHPGFAGTHLVANGPISRVPALASIADAAVRAVAQPPHQGAWPTLMAATADLPGATYVGPGGLGEVRGTPQVTTSDALSHDRAAQEALWALSEETTGISYP